MAISLPPASILHTLSTSSQTAVLDLLFEPSPMIHELLLPYIDLKITTYPKLIDKAHTAFLSLQNTDTPKLHSILGSHPRLGAPKVDSAQSSAEQAALKKGTQETVEKLVRLNAEYEEKFPGLRYVVFVNGRGREEIMVDMVARIKRRNIQLEEKEAIQAMCLIAKDRAQKLLATAAADGSAIIQ